MYESKGPSQRAGEGERQRDLEKKAGNDYYLLIIYTRSFRLLGQSGF